MPVILFHAGFGAFGGGFVGVDIFFVISGYLITSIILAEKEAGTFTFTGFYERRARRILPALFVVILACVPFAWLWLLPSDMKDFSQSLIAVSGFASNILLWQESGYFDTAAELKPLLHTWSLAVEEQYYLVFPVLLLLLWRFGRTAILSALLGIALVSLAAAQWASLAKPEMNFYLLPTRSWELLIGALSAFGLYDKRPRWTLPEGTKRALKEAGGALGLCLIGYSIFKFDQDTPFPGLYALLPTLGAASIILCADQGNVAGKILGSRLLVGIGLISYSAYLWHQPLFAFARHYAQGSAQGSPTPTMLILLSLLAVGLACITWRYVERPFRDRNAIGRRQIFAFSLAGTVALVLFGWAGHASQGFAQRYDARDRVLVLTREQRDGYVWDRLNTLKGRDFTAADKKKVLIVGDSYAGDLINALYETGIGETIQISTHLISAKCGNLYLERDISLLLSPKEQQFCRYENWYADQRLHARMKEADAIWLVSSWKYWQAELLPESKRNLERDFGEKIFVFGRKDFGSINPRKYLQLSDSQRIDLKTNISPQHIKTNDFMRETLPEDFLDVSQLLCADDRVCHPFTKDGKLISFDGGHLTADGARFYGQRLSKNLQFRKLLGQDDERVDRTQDKATDASGPMNN